MSVTITHLIPCTSYTFTVSGRGSGRQGPNSEIFTAITAAEVPERVANIVVIETNLVWDAPSPLTCEMLQYHIHLNLIKIDQCQPSDRNHSFTVKEPNLELLRLESYSTYHVTISAESAAGIGPRSTVEITTPQKDATASPANVTLKNSTNPQALVFTWQEIPCGERRGVIQSYNYTLRNNSSVVEQDVVNTMSVTITHLIPCTSYTFTVSGRGSGRQGPNSKTITAITAAEVPERVANIGVNETNLVWDAPSPLTCEMLQYHIHLNLIKIDQCQPSDRNQSFTVKEPNLELLRLEPYSTYHVTISAESAAGIGPRTTVEIITPPKDATASPANVTLKNSTNPQALVFTWQEIPCGERRGIIQSYNYTLRNNSSVVEQNVVNTMSVTITHLIPCTSYTFTVSGRGSGRQGPNSEIFTAITAAEVPERVANIVVIETNLVWDAPSPLTCEMLQYHIHLNLIKIDQCQPSDRNHSFTVKEPNLELLRLEPYSTYYVTISAESAAGIGPQITVAITTPQKGATASPANVTLKNSTNPRALMFSWQEIPCRERRGVIQSYNYTLRNNSSVVEQDVDNTMSVTITHLIPCTSYTFTVSGRGSGRQGPNSETITAITAAEVPERVANIVVNETNLVWDAPSPLTCEMLRYHIHLNLIKIDQCQPSDRNHSFTVKEPNLDLVRLESYSTYHVTISAESAAGIGPQTTVEITTPPKDATVSPPNVTIKNSTNPRALVFSWQEIPCGERRGVIQSYNYTLRNNSSVVEQDVVNTMSVTITHLIPCTSYTFTVSGRGSGRQGPNSENITVITAAEGITI
ncbi:phosphatidylinositol phosphatase PTPRQ-like [Antedon mediterranea]|uniref:phosphatidylinositol phosphatase PTPRQ-like n=1 Tax=Antedon mediterranea TaxID=105859 RepID=UPI003AF46BD0